MWEKMLGRKTHGEMVSEDRINLAEKKTWRAKYDGVNANDCSNATCDGAKGSEEH